MKQARTKAGKKAIVVRGNEQAAAVADALSRMSPLKARYSIAYVGAAGGEAPDAMDNAIYLEQVESVQGQTPQGARCIRFPVLELKSLWPFTRPNEHNQPELPEYPAGRFPYRDVFISTCVRQQLPTEEIVRLYLASDWSPDAWPDLDALFEREREELAVRDGLCDIRMSDYVLDHFRASRLFVGPYSPTDLLLGELIRGLLGAVFPKAAWVRHADITGALPTLGDRDVLGALAIPIHKRVAEHFGLTWYDRNDVYNYFDRKQLRDVEYYRALIAATAGQDA